MSSNLLFDGGNLPPSSRLLVLMPDFNFDEKVLGRKVWDLAIQNRSDVLFLGVIQSPDQKLYALNQLRGLMAVVQDRRLKVDSRLEFGLSWQKAIRHWWMPGDMIICCSSHRVQALPLRHKSLAELIAQELRLPVYVLRDSTPPQSSPSHRAIVLSRLINKFL